MLWQILGLLLVLIATRAFWRRWKYDLHKVPSPPGLPLLGHTLEFSFGQPSHQISQWVGNCLSNLGYPKLMRVDLMGSSWLFVTDLDFIKNVMLSKTAPFPMLSLMAELAEPLLGSPPSLRPLVTTETPTPYVKAARRIYLTAFQTGNLKNEVKKLDQVLTKMIKAIEDGRETGPIDLQRLFVKMTLDSIGVVAFDSNLGGLDGSRDLYDLLLKAGHVMRDRLTNPMKKAYVKYLPNSKEAKRQNAVIDGLIAEWDKLTGDILERDDPPHGEEPMWHGLRNLKNPETDKRIEYKMLRSEIGTVVIAGMDTTGHQLGWLFGLLASHPHVVDKLLEELKQHGLYGADAREVTFADLGELTYLTATIKEGMRLGDVVDVGAYRAVPNDMSILGYRIPKGTIIALPGSRAMQSEEMWTDPKAFRPDRWLTGEDMSQKYSLAFSVGPRDCPGQRLAMLQMRLTIIKLITRYHFALKGSCEDLLSNAKDGFAIEAKDGVWVNIKPRSTSI